MGPTADRYRATPSGVLQRSRREEMVDMKEKENQKVKKKKKKSELKNEK